MFFIHLCTFFFFHYNTAKGLLGLFLYDYHVWILMSRPLCFCSDMQFMLQTASEVSHDVYVTFLVRCFKQIFLALCSH